MKIYSILVHPNQTSLNGTLFDLANQYFKDCGHTVKTIDLSSKRYEMDESASALYQNTASNVNKGYMSDYNYNYAVSKANKLTSSFAKSEIAKFKEADIIYIQTPILVWTIPALLKFYIENVFVANELFTATDPWSDDSFVVNPLLTGKKVIFSVTMGSSRAMTNSIIGSIEQLMHPYKSMFGFVGVEWVDPHVTWGTMQTQSRHDVYLEQFNSYLRQLEFLK